VDDLSKALQTPSMANWQTSHPPSHAWAQWSIREVADKLSDVKAPWCIAGGWALDMCRVHEDVEIAILQSDWPIFADALSGNRHFAAAGGQLYELPARGDFPNDTHGIWVADETEAVWRLEVLLEPGDNEIWIFRRSRDVRRQRRQMIATSADGVPYFSTEGVLLYKAKAPRAKDDADFRASLDLMSPGARQWLRDALRYAYPGHHWIDVLA
jgi:hypothetical protein